MGPRTQQRTQGGRAVGRPAHRGSRLLRTPALGIAAALTVALGAQAVSLGTSEDVTPVLVAATDLEDGTILQREDVRIDLVPVGSVTPDSLTSGVELSGTVLTEDVAEGQQLTERELPGTVLQGRISQDETAVAAPPALVSTRLVVGTEGAGSLRPGASVRVVVAAPATQRVSQTRTWASQPASGSIIGASGGGVAQPKGDAVERPAAPTSLLPISKPGTTPDPLPDTQASEVSPPEPTPPLALSPRPVPMPPPAAPVAPSSPPKQVLEPSPTVPISPNSPLAPAAREPIAPSPSPTPVAPAPAAPKPAAPSASPQPVQAAPAPARTGIPEPVSTPPVGQVVVPDATIIAVEQAETGQEGVTVVIETAPETVPALVRYDAEEDLSAEILTAAPAEPSPTPAPAPSPDGGAGGTEIAPPAPSAE